MRVILLKDIENLGKKYDIKEVKEGYAKNFLIPKGLVKIADKNTLKWLEKEKEKIKKEEEQKIKYFKDLKESLTNLNIEIEVKVGKNGEFFEKINNQKIANRLKELGYNVEKSYIILKEKIEKIGDYKVKIKLPYNLETEFNLIIKRGN
ncbi:MAG: 50S ribosomal protein L9 [Minisyncoccia bacterium]